jgi:hypothetical protein
MQHNTILRGHKVECRVQRLFQRIALRSHEHLHSKLLLPPLQ